jgi:hypothetical protein
MICIYKNGKREERGITAEAMDRLGINPPPMLVVDAKWPVKSSTEFKLHQVGPNQFVYLEKGANLDLLKDEPRV